jgi:hypothetical protein
MEELNSIEEEIKQIVQCYYEQAKRHRKNNTFGFGM